MASGDDGVDGWLAAHGGVIRREALGAGTANAVERVWLGGGSGGSGGETGAAISSVVTKRSPDTATALTYERCLLATEALVLDAYRAAGLPVPRVLYRQVAPSGSGVRVDADEAVPDVAALVLSHEPGVSLSEVADASDRPGGGERGELLARLHGAGEEAARTHPELALFGYPFRATSRAESLRETYLRLIRDLVEDARVWDVSLERFAPTASGAASNGNGNNDDAEATGAALVAELERLTFAFDRVADRTLVHFDLWDGNLLVEGGHIVTVIDAERALVADPTADLASVALLRDVEVWAAENPDFLAAYERLAGKPLLADADAIARARLWSIYLGLIMFVEIAQRGYDGDWVDPHRESVATWIALNLDALRA